MEAEDEDCVVHKKKTADKKGTNGKKNEVRGKETNYESCQRQTQCMRIFYFTFWVQIFYLF